MADSLSLRIAKDFITKLNANKPTGAPTAELARSLKEAPTPSVLVYPSEERYRRAGSNRSPINIVMSDVDVEIRVKGDSTTNCYTLIDPLITWVKSLDGQLVDGSVDTAALQSIEKEMTDEASRPFLMATLKFTVPYQERVGLPTAAS